MLRFVAVGGVALQRLAELMVSRRHERALREAGAEEVGRRHYPVMVLLHAGWLVATLIESGANRDRGRPVRPAVVAGAGIVMAAAQVLRYWAIGSLGERWTTRILVPADSPLVTTGPYRWLNHPNYVAVVAEIAALPLLLGAPRTAATFSAANAALLAVRVSAENEALDVRRRRSPLRSPSLRG